MAEFLLNTQQAVGEQKLAQSAQSIKSDAPKVCLYQNDCKLVCISIPWLHLMVLRSENSLVGSNMVMQL